MGNKRMSKLQGMALVAAMVASMSSVGYADTQIDFDDNVSLNWNSADPDVQNYWSDNGAIDGVTINIDGTLNVAPLQGTDVTTTPGSGAVGDQVFDVTTPGPGALSYVYTMTEVGETSTEVTTNAGGATIEENGDVTLRGGSTSTVVTTNDYATRLTIDSDPSSPTYGQAIAEVTGILGVYTPGATPGTGTFTPGSGLVSAPVLDTTPGGNLTMDGNFTMNDGNVDITSMGEDSTATFTLNPDEINLHVGGNSTDINMGVDDIELTASGAVYYNEVEVATVADVAAEEAARIADVDAEESARIADVDAEESARIADVNAEESARIAAVNAEASTRSAADAAEQSARIAADAGLQNDIDTEVAIRSSLIHQEEDGIHIGEDSLVYAEDHFDDGGDRLFTTDGEGLAVTETFSVKPAEEVGAVVVDEDDDGTLPGITNDDATSTVYTQTGSVTQTTSSSVGGGVTMETNGDVTLSKADVGGTEAHYLQVTTFLVDNETGLPISGTEEQVGGYLNEEGDFVVLGELDGDGLLDLSALSEEELAAITTEIEASSDGANLTVEGMTTTNGINNSGAKITGVAAGTAATDAVNKGQLDTVNTAVTNEVANRIADVNAEESARIAADGVLQNNINAEASARIAADVALDNRVDDVEVGLGQLNNRVDDVEERLDQVGAFSAAFSALVPNDRVSGNTQLALGYGYYASESALAAGLFHYVNNNVLLNVGASTSLNGGETAGRAGVTIGF